jgi:transposase
MKYSIDPNTKVLLEEEEGSFEQYPLKTAWAVTIHKSQGLTFNKAIIDANASFAHGQVYVALSRCKTLEGLVLSSPVGAHSVIRSGNIDAFNRYAEEIEPNEQQVKTLRKNYFTKLLFEQFSYSDIQSRFNAVRKLLNEHFKNIYPELINQYIQAEERLRNEILTVSEQFRSQLQKLLFKTENAEEDAFLQERIQKAAVYFQEKNNLILQDLLDKTSIETANKEIRKKINDALDLFQTEVRQKQRTLKVCLVQFTVPNYLNAKSKAVIEDETPKQKKKTSKEQKTDTKEQSFTLYKQGKSLEEIAKERSLVVSTIEGHLLYYVKSGEIPLEKLVAPEKIDKINEVLQQNPEATLSEIKTLLGDDYSYGAIRFVREREKVRVD